MYPTAPPVDHNFMIWPNTVIIFMAILTMYVVWFCSIEFDCAKQARREFFKELEES